MKRLVQLKITGLEKWNFIISIQMYFFQNSYQAYQYLAVFISQIRLLGSPQTEQPINLGKFFKLLVQQEFVI